LKLEGGFLMGNSKAMNKGGHEKAMEKAKKMLDKGSGMGEIVSETGLSEDDVTKAKKKWVDQS
jgi:hypothetical protein